MYAAEFARTGFQGGLQWYRCADGKYIAELETPFGPDGLMFRPVSSPVRATGLSTTRPVRLRECKPPACTRWRGTHLVEDAGHWVGGGAAGAGGKYCFWNSFPDSDGRNAVAGRRSLRYVGSDCPSADIALKDFPPWPNKQPAEYGRASLHFTLMRHIVIEIHWSDGGTLSN